MKNTICFFEFPASDLEQAESFYGKIFDWKFSKGPDEGVLLVNTSDQADALSGGFTSRQNENQTPLVYVTVESVDKTTDQIAELGGEVRLPKTALPKMGWIVVAADPEGNSFGLYQPDPEA